MGTLCDLSLNWIHLMVLRFLVEKLEWHPKLNVLWVFKWEPRVWVVGFGLVDSLALVPFNFHISFHLVYLVFCSWINPQTFGTRLKWGWLNKTPIFDHFPVDSTSHLQTLYCKRFVRLRVLIKTHNNNPLKSLSLFAFIVGWVVTSDPSAHTYLFRGLKWRRSCQRKILLAPNLLGSIRLRGNYQGMLH